MDASVPVTAAEESPVVVARRFVTAGIDNCAALQRDDLAKRLHHARARLDEPSTVLYVAGEYKQGKSMLVNALVGSAICPVDDDLSTSTVTWLHYHDPAIARIRRRSGGTSVVEEIPPEDIWRYASERGNPANHLQVDVVHVGLPSQVLAAGLTLVDSPGAGALRGGAAEATLSFLPYADALIFVTDASAELSAPEIRFLKEAIEVCPAVLIALTKIDLYPEWEHIAELDRTHLLEFGLPGVILPLSSVLRFEALQRSDPQMNEESGFPVFLTALRKGVLSDSRMRTASRALDETSRALSLLLTSLRTEHHALTDPLSAEELVKELSNAEHRLAALRRSGARWSTVLGDGIADLNQEIDRHLKSSFRVLLKQFDDRLGEGDPTAQWEPVTEELRASVTALARDVFDQVQSGADELVGRVTDLLRSAGLRTPTIVTPDGVDLGDLWDSSDRSLPSEKRRTVGAGLGALRGTSSGVVLLGVMANLAGIAIATPVAISVGVLFGAKHVIDERKRLIEQRRRQTRAILREYANQAQAELGLESRRAVQELHRLLRDSFSDQITELNGALSNTIRTIEVTLAKTDHERSQRLPLLSQQIERLERLIEQTDAQGDRTRGHVR